MPSYYDRCKCSKLKDRRALQCRSCFKAEPAEKLCRGCRTVFSITAYNLRPNGHGGFKRRSRCKSCEAKATKTHRIFNPAQAKRTKKLYNESHPESVRRWGRRSAWRRCGLDPDEIERLLSTHDGKCAICGLDSSVVDTLHVDHCHETKKFRGFICNSCNIGLGYFKNSIERLEAAAKYLERQKKMVMPQLHELA